MGSVSREHSGIASGINNAVSETAGLLAIAVFGLVMSHAFNARLDAGMEKAKVPAPVREEVREQRAKLAALEVPRDASGTARDAIKQAVGESFVAGFREVELAAALLAAFSAYWGWLCLSRGRGASDARRHRASGARARRGDRYKPGRTPR